MMTLYDKLFKSANFENNGRGLPDSPNPDLPSGFGLTLVDALVQQLGGTLQVERHSGTRFTITFIS